MRPNLSRRGFLEAAGTVVTAGTVAGVGAAQTAKQQAGSKIKIVGVCCSPRKGKTTAAAMQACLEAAKAAAPNVEVELIELAGLKIPGELAAGVPLPRTQPRGQTRTRLPPAPRHDLRGGHATSSDLTDHDPTAPQPVERTSGPSRTTPCS